MILYGASGHGKVIIEILEANGVKVDYVVDDNPEVTELLGYEVRRNTGKYDEAIISIGSAQVRKMLAESLDVKTYPVAIHPSAIVSPRAKLGEGTVVMHGAIVQTCVEAGKHCIINTGASIDHECHLGDYVHVSPHATLCGNVTVGEGSWIGAGATVIQGVKIGKWAMIGAGAVVTQDIPDNVVAVGCPCKIIKKI
jgi:sugar O-acyltransferase (sialic acid O-acetyltransferase NeuD family)